MVGKLAYRNHNWIIIIEDDFLLDDSTLSVRMIELRYIFYGTLTLNISHRTYIESIETAKLRFYSPSKLDFARRSRRFRNSDSVGDGTKIHTLAHVCRPICPKRKVIGFKPLRCAYPLFLFASFLSSSSFSYFLLPCEIFSLFLLFFPIFLPIFLLGLFIHPLFADMAIHFCCFTFIIESFAQPVCRASNSTPSPYAEGSSLRSRETASKNDYSEINNNDITARRRSIDARGNGFRRLTWILPVCDVWCSHRKLHDNK